MSGSSRGARWPAAKLTRAWDTTSARSETDEFGKTLYQDTDRHIVDAVAAIADERGVTRAQVALAWLLRQPGVTAPIVGATKPKHLDDAVASVDLRLSDDECKRLEEHYSPRGIVGFA